MSMPFSVTYVRAPCHKAALPAVLFADGEGREAVSEQGIIGWQFGKVLRLVNQFS